jgi:hypothetical protein
MTNGDDALPPFFDFGDSSRTVSFAAVAFDSISSKDQEITANMILIISWDPIRIRTMNAIIVGPDDQASMIRYIIALHPSICKQVTWQIQRGGSFKR